VSLWQELATAETNHSYLLLAQLGGNQPFFQENSGDIAVPVHDSQTFVGDDMISHVQQGFNRKVQETFSTALPLRRSAKLSNLD
jgi:hypothetical protein